MKAGILGALGLILLALVLTAQVKDEKTHWWAPRFEYNHQNTEILLLGHAGEQAWLEQGEARILAERIIWNRQTKIGQCYERVSIIDQTNQVLITGGEAWHSADEAHSIVRIDPVMILEKDEITVYADEMHRWGKENRSEARGRVRIESPDGTAWGEKAVYYQDAGELVLSGDPWLEDQTNTHRANEIVYFRNENRLVLRGEAKLTHEKDIIHADYLEMIDYDRENKSPAPSGKKQRKNRVAFFKGDVRIFRHDEKGKLESLTVGEEGEFYEQRGYVRLFGEPRLIMVSDNTMSAGAVMEQYRDENLALIKGNASITKGARTIGAQLMRYNSQTKIAEFSGNPVIQEFGDSYRADQVSYDTVKDLITWRGSTMGVVGTASQAQKEANWAAKNQAAVFKLASGANGANLISVVGEVWLSTSGRASTNQGRVSWGKLAETSDSLPRGSHLIIDNTWSWVDLLGRDGLMLRLRGPAHLTLAEASWERIHETNQLADPVLSPEDPVLNPEGMALSPEGAAPSPLEPLTNLPYLSELSNLNPDPGETNRSEASTNQKEVITRRLGRTTWILRHGTALIKPGSSAEFSLLHEGVSCSNLAVPLLAHRARDGELGLIVLSNQAGLKVRARPPALSLVSFRTNRSELEFWEGAAPALESELRVEQQVVLNRGEFDLLEEGLHLRYSNELRLKASELTNQGPTNQGIEPAGETNRVLLLSPELRLFEGFETGLSNQAWTNLANPLRRVFLVREDEQVETRLYLEKDLLSWTKEMVNRYKLWRLAPYPKRQTNLGDLLEELRELSITWGRLRQTGGW